MFAEGLSGSILSQTRSIQGLVSDINLDTWELALVDGLSGARRTLARGDAVPNPDLAVAGLVGSLASLDPAEVSNGFHQLELTATDISGRTSVRAHHD